MGRRGRTPKPSPPRLRQLPQRAEQAEIVDVILEAATRILVEHGLDAITTNRVAEVAGVSVGSLYRYFSNKTAILRALHLRYQSDFQEAIAQVLATSDGQPFRAVAIEVADACVAVLYGQARIHRALWEIRSAAELVSVIDDQLAALVTLSAAMLVARGFATADEAPVLAFVLVHATDGIGKSITAHADHLDARAAARTFAEMAATYIESRRR